MTSKPSHELNDQNELVVYPGRFLTHFAGFHSITLVDCGDTSVARGEERDAVVAFHKKEADRLFKVENGTNVKARAKARWHVEMVKVLEAGIHVLEP